MNQFPNDFNHETSQDQEFQNDNNLEISTPTPAPKVDKVAESFAIISIVAGILAFSLPVPILDILLGIGGLVLAILARNKGIKGLATAGLILSIIGIVVAVLFTYNYFTGDSSWWMPFN